MKKFCFVLLCVLLIGCGAKQNSNGQSQSQDKGEIGIYEEWLGTYQRKDGVLVFIEHDEGDSPDMLSFNIEKGERGIGGYAYIQNDNNQAVYEAEEDGHTLELTLKKNTILIQESNGPSYLKIDLSGEYVKQ